MTDQGIKYAKTQVLKMGHASQGRYKRQRLAISDGLLLRNRKILVPESMKSLVLTKIHN